MNLLRPSQSIRPAHLLTPVCALAVALTACATPVVEQSEPLSDEAAETLYMKRFNSLAEGRSGGAGLGGYDTLEPLKGAQQPSPIPVEAAASLSQAALENAEKYVDGRNTSAFIVWRNGVIEHETYYGEVGQDTPLVSRSLAKPISAIIIGRALAEGYIESLDQPVSDFITEWQGDTMREQILIRHLLDMRSGFLPQALADKPEDILNRAYLHPRHDEIIINEMPVINQPGSRYEYANATSEMVAPLIERATGKRYGEYLTEALLEPLGAKGGSIWVNQIGGTAHSGCCALLPARTYLKLGILLLQDGVWDGIRLLPEGYVSAMRTGTEQNPYYGLGVWLPHSYIERRGYAHPSVPYGKVFHSEPYADKDLFLFDGNGNQVVYMVPSANMVILRVGGRAPKEVAEWDNTFLPNLLIKDAFRENPAALPEAQPM